MTISSQPSVKTYDCTPTATNFCFPFRFLREADLLVHHMLADGTAVPLALTTDYTVTGAGLDSGGDVKLTTAFADGQLRIWLGMQNVQPNTYADNNPFPAQSHEDALDRLTLLTAMREEDFRRSFRVPLGEHGSTVPRTADRAGKLLAWDEFGNAFAVSQISSDNIASLDQARIYWDANESAEPRLLIDPSGEGSATQFDMPNRGGKDTAVVMMQNTMPYVDSSGARFWISVVYDDFTDDDLPPRSKRSRFAASISAKSHLEAPLWTERPIPQAGDKDKPAYNAFIANGGTDAQWKAGGTQGQPVWTDRYGPQEVGALSLLAVADVSKRDTKVEGLVVSAREEIPDDADPEARFPSKGVAIQAITVRALKGPGPDDRRLWLQADVDAQSADHAGDDDGAEDTTSDPGTGNGGFTLRLNGGTTNTIANYYRSWSAVMAGGRAGYLNGICLGKVHHFTDAQIAADVTQDGDGVAGWGGIWGGSSFWHQGTVRIYAKYECPGWICIGHDGIAGDNDEVQNVGGAFAPLDIKVDLEVGHVPANWVGAVLSFNGEQLIGEKSVDWAPPDGTPNKTDAWNADAVGALTFSPSPNQAECEALRNACLVAHQRILALQKALMDHGLIGPAPVAP